MGLKKFCLRVNPDLFDEVKRKAEKEELSVNKYINKALQKKIKFLMLKD